jgi:hypothetical protein
MASERVLDVVVRRHVFGTEVLGLLREATESRHRQHPDHPGVTTYPRLSVRRFRWAPTHPAREALFLELPRDLPTAATIT